MKYNHRKPSHRKLLAKDIIKICLGYGFWLRQGNKELTFIKRVGDYEITIYTSIEAETGEIRTVGADAIRVLVYQRNPEWDCRFSRTINRVGRFKKIGDRLAEAIRIGTWNAENPDKPRWNGGKRKQTKKNKVFS